MPWGTGCTISRNRGAAATVAVPAVQLRDPANRAQCQLNGLTGIGTDRAGGERVKEVVSKGESGEQ